MALFDGVGNRERRSGWRLHGDGGGATERDDGPVEGEWDLGL